MLIYQNYSHLCVLENQRLALLVSLFFLKYFHKYTIKIKTVGHNSKCQVKLEQYISNVFAHVLQMSRTSTSCIGVTLIIDKYVWILDVS